MSRAADVFIPGIPVAKGSARAYVLPNSRRAVVVQDNAAKQKPWAAAIGFAVAEKWHGASLGPIALRMAFNMPRPKSHSTAKGALRPSAPRFHGTKPDVDKLVRCVLDALTGIVYGDDSQVCEVHATKEYAIGNQPGLALGVQEVGTAEQAGKAVTP